MGAETETKKMHSGHSTKPEESQTIVRLWRTPTILVISALALTIVTPSLAQDQVTSQGSRESILETATVVGPLHRFTDQLFTTLSRGAPATSNIVVSPISIHESLSMLLLGADPNSATKQELMSAIGLTLSSSNAEMQRYHEDYAKLLAKFKEISKQLPEMIPSGGGMALRDGRLSSQRPPALDIFSMVITKNKASARPEFQTLAKRYYESSVENVDDRRPQSTARVLELLNRWARQAGFESPIVSRKELSAAFDAILLSAVSVRARWFDMFHESVSNETSFYNFGIKTRPVRSKTLGMSNVEGAKYVELTDLGRARFKGMNQRMGKSSNAFRQLTDLNAQIVQVPLEGGLSYTIIEPLEFSTPTDDKLAKLIGKLFAPNNNNSSTVNSVSESKFTQALKLIDNELRPIEELDLTMPKFKFQTDLSLMNILNAMGVRKAFGQQLAEISLITASKLHVSDIKHQALIDVNAKGIKATGVTKIQVATVSAEVPLAEPTYIAIERPFVFIIRYGPIPLFVGQLTHLDSQIQQ